MRGLRRGFLIALLASIGALTAGRLSTAFASTVTLTNCTESGLAAAISSAGDGGTVLFACPSNPVDMVFNSPIEITQSVTLNGIGQTVSLDGDTKTQLFKVDYSPSHPITLTIAHLDLINGFFGPTAASDLTDFGGGAIMAHGDLVIVDSVFGNNNTDSKLVAQNSGQGGAINGGNVTVIASTFSDNSADNSQGEGSSGGAIAALNVVIRNSTFMFNHADVAGFDSIGAGGAVSAPTVDITNSTFFGNHATASCCPGSRNTSTGEGGAIDTSSGSISNTTIAGNYAGRNPSTEVGVGGGIFHNYGTLNLKDTIVTDNMAATAGPDCAASPSSNGPITSLDYNLFGSLANCALTGTTTHNLVGYDPLGSLGNYGGPTQTIPDSAPAKDDIPLASCGVSVDQRGYARGDGGDGKCDIGAFEAGSTTCVPPTFPRVVVSGTPPVATVTVKDANVGLDTVTVASSNNATVTVTPFSPGAATTTVTVQRTDPSRRAAVTLQATNTTGCTGTLDPAMTEVVRAAARPFTETLTGSDQSENQLTIINGTPGLNALIVRVNTRGFTLAGLRAGEQRTISIASALHAGSNSVQLVGVGLPGGSATVLIGAAQSG